MCTTILQKDIHPLAIQVCSALQAHGYQAFIVGGCVRDLFLGTFPKDWDICTDASPEKIMNIFPRTIPTGLQHGTITVCMGKGVENHFEVTTFRVEGKYTDGRRPEEVKFVNNLIDDLARRDLTINAIAYDPISNIAIDPFHGMKDIEAGIIRAVGNAAARFQEDGLRIMRVARFAARFGYRVDLETMNGMKLNLSTLQKVSKERINDELCKTLMAKNPAYGLQILMESGALDIACPLLTGRRLPKLHGNYSGELETRIAFLYNNMSHLIVEQELIDLKFSIKSIKRVTFLLQKLRNFRHLDEGVFPYRQFIASFKNEAPDPWEYTYGQFIELTKAMEIPAEDLLSKYQDTLVHSRKELAINGNDLLEKGIKAGPLMKQLLDCCYLEILRNPEHNQKELLLNYALKQIY